MDDHQIELRGTLVLSVESGLATSTYRYPVSILCRTYAEAEAVRNRLDLHQSTTCAIVGAKIRAPWVRGVSDA